MSSFNPIRRSRLKPKPKRARTSAPWRAPKVRLDAEGMLTLRWNVFLRSERQCECEVNGKRCRNRFGFYDFQMHHVIHRSRGGSDSEENCIAACDICHMLHHDGKRRITVYEPEARP